MPKCVKSIEFVHGNSTTLGCIKQVKLREGSPLKYVRNKVDEIDFDKYYAKYTTIEGDVLVNTLESITYDNMFEASGTGCHFTMVAHYHTKGDAAMEEQHIAATKESIKENFKAIEEYLLPNRQIYA